MAPAHGINLNLLLVEEVRTAGVVHEGTPDKRCMGHLQWSTQLEGPQEQTTEMTQMALEQNLRTKGKHEGSKQRTERAVRKVSVKKRLI